MTSNRSAGEEAYAQTFQFAPTVPKELHEDLRDFLYKYTFNLSEAQDYLQILRQVNDIKYNKRELLYRIHGMALQCFALAMRRMTDELSERSLRKLINKVVDDEFKAEEIKEIKEIHSHYKIYVNKGVAHQDLLSIKEILESFPDTEIIDKDIKHLEELYYKIVKGMCTKFLNVSREVYDYEPELKMLVIDKKTSRQ